MGWKTVKEHYRIEHIVQVRDGQILIGSSYVSNLILVSKDGTVKWGNLGPSENDDLARYFSEMTADKERLVSLIEAPDSFTRSLPVYTYEGGAIIEKSCEEYGWPNVTHDGLIQYDSFSKDREKVIARAKANARAGIKIMTEQVSDLRADLIEREAWLANFQAHLLKLETEHPNAEV